MVNTTVGTCSLCGGRVSVPDASMSILKPKARCEACGAVEAKHGPIVPMVRPAPVVIERFVSQPIVISAPSSGEWSPFTPRCRS